MSKLKEIWENNIETELQYHKPSSKFCSYIDVLSNMNIDKNNLKKINLKSLSILLKEMISLHKKRNLHKANVKQIVRLKKKLISVINNTT